MYTYYDKRGTAPSSSYIGELFSTPVLKVIITKEGAEKLLEMLEEDSRIPMSSSKAEL